MNKYGLIGQDISYSKSVDLHNIIKKVYKLNFNYELIDINILEIDSYLNSNYSGFNVTKPFKEVVYNKIKHHTKIVKEVKAVNTLFFKGKKLFGDNTDYYGFEYLIKYYNIDVKNKKIAILGTGGAAKVVYFYLSKYSKDVYYISRNKTNNITLSYDNFEKNNFDIIINATPTGTSPNDEESILTKEQVNNSTIIDLVYNPLETKLMSYSSNSYNGLVMLIVQALYSHKRWHKIKITNDKIKEIKELLLNV